MGEISLDKDWWEVSVSPKILEVRQAGTELKTEEEDR